jgi:hypothetical protein
MSATQVMGLVLGAVTILTIVWRMGRWMATREVGEVHARDLTRDRMARMEPALDKVLELTQRNSEDLAVIKHQTADHGTRLAEVETRLDEHGNRITALEAKET